MRGEETFYPYLNSIGSFTEEPSSLLWVEDKVSDKITKKYAIEDLARKEINAVVTGKSWLGVNVLIEYIIMREYQVTLSNARDICCSNKPSLVYENCNKATELVLRYTLPQ